MTPHAKIYLRYFGYGEQDFIPCEICGSRAVDIHHIQGRGKYMNIISNLMGLCRLHHTDAHNEKIKKEELQKFHNDYLNEKNPVNTE